MSECALHVDQSRKEKSCFAKIVFLFCILLFFGPGAVIPSQRTYLHSPTEKEKGATKSLSEQDAIDAVVDTPRPTKKARVVSSEDLSRSEQDFMLSTVCVLAVVTTWCNPSTTPNIN